jgi:glycosyltransferase involved in cell wall biosynthesis
MANPRVVYRNNIASPYMVERFDRIAARGNVDLDVWFDQPLEPDRSWEVREQDWVFRHRWLAGLPGGTLLGPARAIRAERPDVLVTLYENPSFLLGAAAAKASRVRVVLHAMKVFDTWRRPRRSRELAKRLLFPRVDAIHVPGEDAAAYVRRYGARNSQLAMFAEAVDVEHFARGAAEARAACAPEEAALPGCVFLYVGRLWRGKGLDYLFDAYESLLRGGAKASLVLLGDGVDEARYRERARGLANVLFAGFAQKPDLPRWYGLADVLVFPTLGDPYGHVVQEAMASSLPVVATESAGEIRERVLDGTTGFVVPAADAGALERAMATLAASPALRASMGCAGFERIRPRTIDWWAGEFERMIERVLRAPAAAR